MTVVMLPAALLSGRIQDYRPEFGGLEFSQPPEYHRSICEVGEDGVFLTQGLRPGPVDIRFRERKAALNFTVPGVPITLAPGRNECPGLRAVPLQEVWLRLASEVDEGEIVFAEIVRDEDLAVVGRWDKTCRAGLITLEGVFRCPMVVRLHTRRGATGQAALSEDAGSSRQRAVPVVMTAPARIRVALTSGAVPRHEPLLLIAREEHETARGLAARARERADPRLAIRAVELIPDRDTVDLSLAPGTYLFEVFNAVGACLATQIAAAVAGCAGQVNLALRGPSTAFTVRVDWKIDGERLRLVVTDADDRILCQRPMTEAGVGLEGLEPGRYCFKILRLVGDPDRPPAACPIASVVCEIDPGTSIVALARK